MAQIRTTRFGTLTSTGTALAVVYTVPSNRRALVRSFNVLNARNGTIIAYLYVYSPGGLLLSGDALTIPTLVAGRSDPWLVAEAGETLRMAFTGAPTGTAYGMVSGVLFDTT